MNVNLGDRFPGSARTLLWLVILGGLVLRAVPAVLQGDTVEPLPAIHDQVSYHALACRVLEGHGFSFGENWWPATRAGEPTAHWSFLYTLFLTGIYGIFGVHPLIARILQVLVVGILQPWLTFRIGSRLFGVSAGMAAAIVSSAYGYFVYYAGALVTEPLYIVSILWTIDLAYQVRTRVVCGRPVSAWNWTLLGISVGITVLLRQVFLLFLPLLFAWLFAAWYRKAGFRYSGPMLRGMLTTSLAVLLMVLPWTVRNYLVFNQFVLLNTNAGFAFFWGNHPIHGSRFIPILEHQETNYEQLIPRAYQGLNEAALDRALLRDGIGFVAEDPVRYAALSISRMREYFKFWPSSDSGWKSNLVRVLSAGLLFPLILLGLVRVALDGREAEGEAVVRVDSGSALLIVFGLFYTGLHLASWVLIRYRLPVDGVLMPFAGTGAVWGIRSLQQRLRGIPGRM